MRRLSRLMCRLPLVVLFGFCWAAVLAATVQAEGPSHWYKGNTHGHTFWSDGDEFPEMVADWYKSHGYDFVAISDHDKLMAGEKWISVDHGKRFVPNAVVEKCQKRFGQEWLEMRDNDGGREVKLKTFDEVRNKIAEPGKFCLIPNEEIGVQVGDRALHISAINLAEPILGKVGRDVPETIALNLATIRQQAERLQRTILHQVNHPNFVTYDISAEDLAAASDIRFFEVSNGHPGVRNLGDATHPSTEKLWDIANTVRVGKLKLPPLCAIASDDAHSYQQKSPGHANPGRGWIMVHAGELTPDALVAAIDRGDFYASTGVVLRDVGYDAKERTLRVEVEPEAGVAYTIEFIGTLEGVDPTGQPIAGEDPHAKRPGRTYSPEVGKVLASVHGPSGKYHLTGKELYVRAAIRSNRPVAEPSAACGRWQEAWCQPVVK